MKVALTIVLCLGCSLLAYIVGHWKGYSTAARLEISGGMSFLMLAREQIEDGETASAVQIIDKGLDAGSNALLKIEGPGVKPGILGSAFGAGAPEKTIATLRGHFATSANRQRTPFPEKVYTLLKLPVVPGNPISSGDGSMPMIPAQEGGAQSPSAGSTIQPAPAPKQQQLPPGIERRQR